VVAAADTDCTAAFEFIDTAGRYGDSAVYISTFLGTPQINPSTRLRTGLGAKYLAPQSFDPAQDVFIAGFGRDFSILLAVLYVF
jgi:hypothetical protein